MIREETKDDVTLNLSQNLSQREVDRIISRLKTNKADELPIVAPVTAKQSQRKLQFELWTEALHRLSADDTDAAVTTAGALLKAICKMALRETNTPYFEDADLPKLYGLVSVAVGLSAGPQTTETVKSMFGATASLVRSVAELSNQVGSAQEGVEGRLSLPYPQAELAVNVAGALAQFLMTVIENYIVASDRMDEPGKKPGQREPSQKK